MGTRPGERVMQPDYGCRLHDLVFDPMTAETEAEIEVAITRAILFFEPRIVLNSVQVADDWRAGTLRIRLEFRVRSTNARHNRVFPFYRTEGTLISAPPEPGT
ncbi:GPW/gp25 family protein [Rhodovulum marinum]|uniref:IraD/Gp25-like domain-containing protein n=1 Tax=Rhodovulum marinum TaxID=320662 RepID=A0A4R2PXY1_9RHOB|nr:GPW/gp25 family protein [Rhodovulum marinum]TCP40184.1 hypothetical protein EV662_10858 [Rhodovulum marinum]